mgnify:FL=1
MQNLQYVIDTICARFTADSIYDLIEERLKQGPLVIGEILPLIQSKDRSLDVDSAKTLAQTALDDLGQRGRIRTEGYQFFPWK